MRGDGFEVGKSEWSIRSGKTLRIAARSGSCLTGSRQVEGDGGRRTFYGPMRFNAITRSTDGVSHRMLALTLRSLECDGLVKRTAYATIPPKVEYELTKMGRSLIEPLETIARWAQRNRPAIEAARVWVAAEKGRNDCRPAEVS
jgi:DNA-binding HxlR family transcriptional regulator